MTRRNMQGFTLIEVLFVTGVISILAAIAAPALRKARMAANESSAIGSIRNLHSAQQVFWGTCGSGYYSPSMQNLGLPVAGGPGFLGPDLSAPVPVVKTGYEIDMDSTHPMAGTSCNGGSLVVAYHVTADPLPGQGTRYFGANSGGAIYQSSQTLFASMPDSGPAPAPAIPIQQ